MKNESVRLNLEKPENWVISRIIKNKCKVNRNFQIIEFIDKEIWTYDDLFSLGLKAAHFLNDLNLKKNDPVLVMINDPKKFIPIWVGSSFLGLKFVAINTALRGSVLLHQITMSSAKVILLEDEYYDEVLKTNFNEICYMSCALLKDKSTIYDQFAANFSGYSFPIFLRYFLVILIGFGPFFTLNYYSMINNNNKIIFFNNFNNFLSPILIYSKVLLF